MHRIDIIVPKLSISILLLLGGPLLLRGQAPVYYDDVALILNTASDSSVMIGEYFAAAREIPERHILRIDAPVSETINDAQFEAMRSEIERLLTERNLVDSINYLVTTKGLPLRINRPSGDTANSALTARRASVESELMLILGPLADSIGNVAWMYHDYGFNSRNRHFRRAEQGFYLVTRLDAFTVDDVKRMIDNGGPNRLVDRDSVLFVLDREPGARDPSFDQSQIIASQVLQARGWRVLLNSDSIYVTDQSNVIGYASWGSNDRYHGPFADHAIPRNTWSIGALAETFVSTSARSLQPGTTYGQSLIADWIAEGVTGAKGYVFEPFTVALAFPHVYMDRYTDELQGRGYNMAESFAMASRTLSWMEVVLGDPKTSIITGISPAPEPTLSDTTALCTGSPSTLSVEDPTRAFAGWFRGDTNQVRSAGERFDERHPLFIGEGKSIAVTADLLPEGIYTYAATNLSGVGMAQTVVVHLLTPSPDFSIPSGTIEPGRGVQFTDLTQEEGIRTWDFGDGSDPVTGSNPVHTFDEEGTYFVSLTVNNGGCEGIRRRVVQVRSESSVDGMEFRRIAGLRFSPIPARESITVSDLPEGADRIRLRIYDAVGTLLRWGNLEAGGTGRIRIGLDGLPSGVCIVELEFDDHTVRKLVPIL